MGEGGGMGMEGYGMGGGYGSRALEGVPSHLGWGIREGGWATSGRRKGRMGESPKGGCPAHPMGGGDLEGLRVQFSLQGGGEAA